MEFTPQQLLTGIRNARQQNLNDTALDLLRRLLSETNPDGHEFGKEWDEILDHALALADEDVALEITRRQIARFPNEGRYVLLMAERLSRVGRSNTALEVIRNLKTRMAHNPALDYFEGVYAGHVGELEQSKACFRNAIKGKSDFGDAWALLGAAGGLSEADIPALKTIVEQRQAHALPGAAYALGGLYHRLGKPEEAWENWSLANETLRSRQPYTIENELTAQRAIIEADSKIWTDRSAFEDKPPRVVFVVGPPRSGTSLVEQIIAASSPVTALGETMLSRLSTWPAGNLSEADLNAIGALSPPGATWTRFGAAYRHLASVRSGNASIVTDKGALLHLFVGALSRMLPTAKFVWVQRDPRDIAFSAWRSYLTDGNRWRHNLSDAAKYLKAHDDMMSHWHRTMPDRVYPLSYADLVQSPQAETDKLTDFLEIPDVDLGKADFSDANVPTASFAQIRGQISPQSVGSWKPYEQWIAPEFS